MLKKEIDPEKDNECSLCKIPLIISDGSKLCESCGSIYEENTIFVDEFNSDQKNYLNLNRLYWSTQKYDSSFNKDCTVRRYLHELAQKVEFPDNMRAKTEALVKIILSDNPSLSKSLKAICHLCAYLKMRIRDPNYSIKVFCEKCEVKPKSLLKHMTEITQYTYDNPHVVKKEEEVQNEEREYFCRTLDNISLTDLLSKDTHLALSLFEKNLNPKKEKHQDCFQENLHTKIKEKIRVYGLILLEHEKLYPIKFGKKLDKFIASIIFLICKFLDLPVTMKKLSTTLGVSHISISRMTKEITVKIVEVYREMRDSKKIFENKAINMKTDPEEDHKPFKSNDDDELKDLDNHTDFNKALKHLYKLDKKKSCIE